MTQRSRVEQRDHLMTSLGMIVAPIRRLVEDWPKSQAGLLYFRERDYA
jgi:hypothetical protein